MGSTFGLIVDGRIVVPLAICRSRNQGEYTNVLSHLPCLHEKLPLDKTETRKTYNIPTHIFLLMGR